MPSLVDDLLLPQRWASAILVPDKLVLLVETAGLVSDRNDLACVPDLLLRHTSIIFRNLEIINIGRKVKVNAVIHTQSNGGVDVTEGG